MRVCQLGRGLDDLLQDGIERKLRGERDARIDDRAQTVHFRHG